LTLSRRETLFLSIPSDPGLARIARLVSLHFLKQNGVRTRESRLEAGLVETRCRALLRASAVRGTGRASRRSRVAGSLMFVLTLVSGIRELEVRIRRNDGSGRRRLLRLRRPAAP